MINLEYSISNEEIVEASLKVPNFLELSKKIKVPYVSLMARIKEETDLEKEVIRNFQANRSEVVYNVMDTSLTGCKNPIDEVKTLISKGERIVIVSPVLKELTNNIKHFADLCASNSRNVMSMACADSENFENVLVEENPAFIPDDQILQFCMENNKISNIVLLTADKELCLKARQYMINVKFFAVNKKKESDQVFEVNGLSQLFISQLGQKIKLNVAENDSRGLIFNISQYNNDKLKTSVFANGLEYKSDEISLSRDDEIWMALQDYNNQIVFLVFSVLVEKGERMLYCKSRFNATTSEEEERLYGNYLLFVKEFKYNLSLQQK